ncbi:MAG: ATP-binding protein [Candidatus Wallbacteria bacterium]|nr:ATP-binding protein [Candidatus Wallbacteria bacterium]
MSDQLNTLISENRNLLNRVRELELMLAKQEPEAPTLLVPEQFKGVFDHAQKIVAEYFQQLHLSPTKGTIRIADERYVLIRASALSINFLNIIRLLYSDKGEEEALAIGNNLLFDFSHMIGMADARDFHAKMHLTDPISKLSVGPFHFAHTGWALVNILPESRPSPDKEYFLIYEHPYSFEAESWLESGVKSDHPVCIMNCGYSSGWCEESFGIPLTAVEISCRATGSSACRFVMAHPEKIKEHLQKYLANAPEYLEKTGKYSIPTFFERKLIEERLSDSEKKFRDIAHSSAELIWEIDDKLRICFAAGKFREILGYEPAEMYGRFPSDFMSEHESQKMSKEYARLSRKMDAIVNLEFNATARNGKTLNLVVNGIPIIDRLGRLTGYRGVCRDLTAQRKLEEQFQQAQKMEIVGQLAGGIAHDFNNLLTPVLGYAQLIRKSILPTHPFHEKIEGIINSTQKARDLTRQLLTFSHKGIANLKAMNLNGIILNFKEILTRSLTEKIVLEFELCENLSSARIDQGQMEQVLLNLVINGRDAMNEGGKLVISTANVRIRATDPESQSGLPEGDYVKLSVSDTGCGMDSSIRQHIFEPFFTTKDIGKGTGLGLAIVYGIIRLHGGDIYVDSVPDSGTTFRLYLPASGEKEPLPSTDVKTETPSRGNENILLVDDDENVLKFTKSLLEESGYRVFAAVNPSEAMRIFTENQGIELLVTDMIMPQMNGSELFRKFSARCPDLKVLYMSGFLSNSIIGNDDLIPEVNFILKPFQNDQIMTMVRQILDQRS